VIGLEEPCESPWRRLLKRPPNLMFPVSGQELTPYSRFARAGCRGVTGLVPQPLCMKSRLARSGQTGMFRLYHKAKPQRKHLSSKPQATDSQPQFAATEVRIGDKFDESRVPQAPRIWGPGKPPIYSVAALLGVDPHIVHHHLRREYGGGIGVSRPASADRKVQQDKLRALVERPCSGQRARREGLVGLS